MAEQITTAQAAAPTASPAATAAVITEQLRHSSIGTDTQEAADAAASTHSCREPLHASDDERKQQQHEEEEQEDEDEEEIDIAALKRQKVPLEPGPCVLRALLQAA